MSDPLPLTYWTLCRRHMWLFQNFIDIMVQRIKHSICEIMLRRNMALTEIKLKLSLCSLMALMSALCKLTLHVATWFAWGSRYDCHTITFEHHFLSPVPCTVSVSASAALPVQCSSWVHKEPIKIVLIYTVTLSSSIMFRVSSWVPVIFLVNHQ